MMSSQAVAPVRRVLHSWKDIAGYTGRGVRTVQRYEIVLRFPVHRPAGSPRSAVLAFSDEIDRWLADTPVRIESAQPVVFRNESRSYVDQVAKLHARAKREMENLAATRHRLQQTVQQVTDLKERLRRARELRQSHYARTAVLCSLADVSQAHPSGLRR
jgi:hypothetical protein